MSKHFSPKALIVLLCAAALPGLAQAQEKGFYKDLKLRLAWAPSTKDDLRQSSTGLGLNLGYSTGETNYAVELGYYSKGGDSFTKTVNGDAPAGLSSVDPSLSGDSRRNSLDGFSLRVTLDRKLMENWRWHAGLMLGGTRFKHEYVGDVRSQDWNAANLTSWRDTYSGTPTEGGLKPSPFAGVSWAATSISSLELSLMLLNYTALDYVHNPGTGTYALDTNPASDPGAGRIAPHNEFPADRLQKSNRLVPHLEIAYVFHF